MFCLVPFHQPMYGLVSSLEVNRARFEVNGKPVEVADIPGLLPSLLEEALDEARCVIFVVDCSRIDLEARRDAELLHEVLTHDTVFTNKTPVLVFCNKFDLPSASSPEVRATKIQFNLNSTNASLRPRHSFLHVLHLRLT